MTKARRIPAVMPSFRDEPRDVARDGVSRRYLVLIQHGRQRSHGYDGQTVISASLDDREQLRSSQTEFNASARFVDDAIRRDECR